MNIVYVTKFKTNHIFACFVNDLFTLFRYKKESYTVLGEWNKIDVEMDLLESGHTRNLLKFKASTSDINRQYRLLRVLTVSTQLLNI